MASFAPQIWIFRDLFLPKIRGLAVPLFWVENWEIHSDTFWRRFQDLRFASLITPCISYGSVWCCSIESSNSSHW